MITGKGTLESQQFSALGYLEASISSRQYRVGNYYVVSWLLLSFGHRPLVLDYVIAELLLPWFLNAIVLRRVKFCLMFTLCFKVSEPCFPFILKYIATVKVKVLGS